MYNLHFRPFFNLSIRINEHPRTQERIIFNPSFLYKHTITPLGSFPFLLQIHLLTLGEEVRFKERKCSAIIFN